MRKKSILFYWIIIYINNIYCANFDSNYYNQVNVPIVNTNFDWEYYIKNNNLQNINNENEALIHYNKEGKSNNLKYCQTFNIGIFLHLYYLNLMDEFAERINYFMSINSLNDFIIKINIPIDQKNISSLNLPIVPNILPKEKMDLVLKATPYHKHIINHKNFQKLFSLLQHLKNKINLPHHKIQIIFSENRGLDIGGFFLLSDQLKQQNAKLDYIVKIHSKGEPNWRNNLLSILNLRINKLLRNYEYIYSVPAPFIWRNSDCNLRHLNLIINKLNVSNNYQKDFIFCGGTMFIVSQKMVDFLATKNLLKLYEQLNSFIQKPLDCFLEHGYERFFGYLGQFLNLKLIIPLPSQRIADERL